MGGSRLFSEKWLTELSCRAYARRHAIVLSSTSTAWRALARESMIGGSDGPDRWPRARRSRRSRSDAESTAFPASVATPATVGQALVSLTRPHGDSVPEDSYCLQCLRKHLRFFLYKSILYLDRKYCKCCKYSLSQSRKFSVGLMSWRSVGARHGALFS